MEQVQRIARAASDVTVLDLEACGHSPQRDQPTKVLTAFECAPDCSHNGLALTKQKTFMIACTADPGAILEVELAD